MSNYKGFDINTASTPAPWGAREQQMVQDVIDTSVGDCVSINKDTTGHKHPRLYNMAGETLVSGTLNDRLTMASSSSGESTITLGKTGVNLIIDNVQPLGENKIVMANGSMTISNTGTAGTISVSTSGTSSHINLTAAGNSNSIEVNAQNINLNDTVNIPANININFGTGNYIKAGSTELRLKGSNYLMLENFTGSKMLYCNPTSVVNEAPLSVNGTTSLTVLRSTELDFGGTDTKILSTTTGILNVSVSGTGSALGIGSSGTNSSVSITAAGGSNHVDIQALDSASYINLNATSTITLAVSDSTHGRIYVTGSHGGSDGGIFIQDRVYMQYGIVQSGIFAITSTAGGTTSISCLTSSGVSWRPTGSATTDLVVTLNDAYNGQVFNCFNSSVAGKNLTVSGYSISGASNQNNIQLMYDNGAWHNLSTGY